MVGINTHTSGGVNLADPDAFLKEVPHDYFRFLRQEAPLTFSPRQFDGGFWNVVRYEDISEIEKNVEVFSSRTNVSPLEVAEAQLANTIDRSIILCDPPQHTWIRKSILHGFTPPAIKKLEEAMQVYARRAIDAVIESGSCDWHDVAAYTPIEIVADILGVPSHDRQKLFDWANAMFGQSDPELSDHQKSVLSGFQMISYARRTAQRRRRSPLNDVFSMIANAEEGGRKLSDTEIGATFIVLATAGNETTRTQFLHGTADLIERPHLADEIRQNLSLLPNAIDEMLRFTTPALGFARKALRDFDMHGQTIKSGDRLKANQLAQPSGDWAVVSPDGTLNVDVRATLETDDGATIFVRYEGRSDYTQAGRAPIIVAPLFETNDPRYAWLNKVQAIAKGRSTGMSELVYEVYEVR